MRSRYIVLSYRVIEIPVEIEYREYISMPNEHNSKECNKKL